MISLFQKHEFSVDMTCEGCAEAVSRVLNKLGGEWFSSGESMGSHIQVYAAYEGQLQVSWCTLGPLLSGLCGDVLYLTAATVSSIRYTPTPSV